MTTTSLKLPDELKLRAAEIAKAQGQSTHAWLVDAVRRAADQSERRAEFVASAATARSAALASGTGYSADDVQHYIRQKVGGNNVARPSAKPFR